MIQSGPTCFQTVDCHNIPINVSSYEQALKEVEQLIALKKSHYVCFFEANLFSQSLQDEKVREVISKASLIYSDGIAPAKCASWCSGIDVTRVSGPTFLLKACEYGISKKWRHFFLGGADGVAEKLAAELTERYPGIEIAGIYCPPFRPLTGEEELDIKKKIEESRTDLLWVGLGGPKQEFWMNDHQGQIDVPVMLGVGAAFDFHSGNRPWAPKIIRKLGLEWLWRMVSGGKKTFIRNVKCVSRIFCVLFLDFLKFRIFFSKKTPLKTRKP